MPTWDEWVRQHALLHCWDQRDDISRLYAWAELFERAGRTPEQLIQASEYLVTQQSPPQYRSDHLRLLRMALVALQQAAPRDEQPTTGCLKCNGTGRVIVPRPAGSRQPTLKCGIPYQGTFAVLCSCLLGDWYFRSQSDYKRRPMTLLEYSKINPDWLAQVVAEEQLNRQQVQDRNTDKVLAAIVQRSRLPPPERAVLPPPPPPEPEPPPEPRPAPPRKKNHARKDAGGNPTGDEGIPPESRPVPPPGGAGERGERLTQGSLWSDTDSYPGA